MKLSRKRILRFAVVDLPKDIQREYGSDVYPERGKIREEKPEISGNNRQIRKAVDLLNYAKRLAFLAGGGINISRANREMLKLAEITGVPVITVPAAHNLYVGNIGIHGSYAANMAVSRCDVLFAIGTRFNDRITGKIERFAPEAAVIHADIDRTVISRNIAADVSLVADAGMVMCELIKIVKPLDIKAWGMRLKNGKDSILL